MSYNNNLNNNENNINNMFKSIPAVDLILEQPIISSWNKSISRSELKKLVNEALSIIRTKILSKEFDASKENIVSEIAIYINEKFKFSLHSVINATGTVLHTNLGRAILSDEVREAIINITSEYNNLEYNIIEGTRGSRYTHLQELLQRLTGAEDVLIVNNNAAAVLLALNTISLEKKIIISRGELVEIGGSFRIPEIILASGAELIEIGTTNKTHLYDYENALKEEPSLVMKVHTSNYKQIGFTKSVNVNELVNFAHNNNLPFMIDLGSGLLIDLQTIGLPHEMTVSECIDAGCDIVTFSADKLLGGPQAGIIVGKKDIINRMRSNQLLRALRVDKLTLIALEATLRLYLNRELAFNKIPTLQMLTQSMEELTRKAEKLQKSLNNIQTITANIIESYSEVGGGAYPGEYLPTKVVEIYSNKIKTSSLEELIRLSPSHIISKIKNDKILFDVRTIKHKQIGIIVDEITKIIDNY